ncbi:hypothetical protein BDF19DRAFT_396087 [Syncephalis fuscata]|nr:hypothetical protein BDF19DRAFT_396087 [Syncephalis fuscata]
MAGDQNITRDPALERWAAMRENSDAYFRWNRRNVRLGVIFGVAVPLAIYGLTTYTTNRYAMIGPRRQGLLAKKDE